MHGNSTGILRHMIIIHCSHYIYIYFIPPSKTYYTGLKFERFRVALNGRGNAPITVVHYNNNITNLPDFHDYDIIIIIYSRIISTKKLYLTRLTRFSRTGLMQIRSESRRCMPGTTDHACSLKKDTIYTASNVILYLNSARKFLILYDS